ncbi:MAG: DUF1592 domain-containing protein, partial [Gemmatimonadetes bacterium]|nr:DUF1592 domain-containing protein [Gemmatimonadota bacterium]NIR77119.1 DUF1592 domain-containing protein [Gemmatimonadota bacterium]NIT85637.1 DUF1592 domain-containing protein [Gemmatimonadota bacterium]NIU29469.1 DUF1592 domain-containing protein [Gemmatimonadota bacterium]NIV59885.1 DUF1592 domain-containing protein [Gemmatimonadota bacterium]
MRAIVAGALSALLVVGGHGVLTGSPETELSTATAAAPAPTVSSPDIPPEVLTEVVVRGTCQACHNDALLTGNLSLEEFEVGEAPRMARTAEKMIVKLRAGMMPPPGVRRPGGDTLLALVETLEGLIDEAAAEDPDPGDRPFQRLNRAEYEASIADLLGLEIDAGDYLPLDTKSANFDNIADVQMLSATLMDAYLQAAAEVSRLAVGFPDAQPSQTTYSKSGYHSQWDRVEGAPHGTRGGISVLHNFPADGEYVLTMAFDHTTTGGFYGNTARNERIEIAVDGERRALLRVDQFMHVSDPNMVEMKTEPIPVSAGPHRVSAAFVKRTEGPVPDLLSPHEWSLADRRIGAGGYGITALPHMKDLAISGPYAVTGVSETPSRRRIFSCRPASPEEARPCAETIVARLAREAYRRPPTDRDLADLMSFYDEGAAQAGFELGIRTALEAILASPDFVFRFEEPAGRVQPDGTYRIGDLALASRLSFFLWGAPPDDELVELAAAGRLSTPEVLEAQTRRMLADPRAEALGTRFAAQWLRLQDLDKVHPDRLRYPDYDQQLADAMRRETELFFYSLVREDRSLLDLFTA